MLYSTECWAIRKIHVHKMDMVEIRMLKWMYGIISKNRIRNETIHNKIKVAPIENNLREGRFKWFGYVQRKPRDVSVRKSDLIHVKRKIGRHKLKITRKEVKEILIIFAS